MHCTARRLRYNPEVPRGEQRLLDGAATVILKHERSLSVVRRVLSRLVAGRNHGAGHLQGEAMAQQGKPSHESSESTSASGALVRSPDLTQLDFELEFFSS